MSAQPEPTLLQRLTTTFSIRQWPGWWTFALAVADSAVTVLNQTTLPHAIGYGSAVKTTVTLLLGAFAFLGIGPVLGPKFRAFVHLPGKVAGAISMALLVGLVVVQQKTRLPYSAIIIGFVQFAGGLGFHPAYIPTA